VKSAGYVALGTKGLARVSCGDGVAGSRRKLRPRYELSGPQPHAAERPGGTSAAVPPRGTDETNLSGAAVDGHDADLE